MHNQAGQDMKGITGNTKVGKKASIRDGRNATEGASDGLLVATITGKSIAVNTDAYNVAAIGLKESKTVIDATAI